MENVVFKPPQTETFQFLMLTLKFALLSNFCIAFLWILYFKFQYYKVFKFICICLSKQVTTQRQIHSLAWITSEGDTRLKIYFIFTISTTILYVRKLIFVLTSLEIDLTLFGYRHKTPLAYFQTFYITRSPKLK